MKSVSWRIDHLILSLDRVQLFTDKVAVHGDVHVRKSLVISQSPAQDEIVLGQLWKYLGEVF